MVALVTPFKDGGVDWQSLEGLIDFHLHNGTHGIVPCGTTGESATLSHQEHDEVIRAVIKAVNKRVPVIAGTGSNSTKKRFGSRAKRKSLALTGPDDFALLQSPHARRHLSALQKSRHRMSAFRSLSTIFPAAPDPRSSRKLWRACLKSRTSPA